MTVAVVQLVFGRESAPRVGVALSYTEAVALRDFLNNLYPTSWTAPINDIGRASLAVTAAYAKEK